jgi:hypothetical protein
MSPADFLHVIEVSDLVAVRPRGEQEGERALRIQRKARPTINKFRGWPIFEDIPRIILAGIISKSPPA